MPDSQRVYSREMMQGGYTFLKEMLYEAIRTGKPVRINTGDLIIEYEYRLGQQSFADGTRVVSGTSAEVLEAFSGVARQYAIPKGVAELAQEGRVRANGEGLVASDPAALPRACYKDIENAGAPAVPELLLTKTADNFGLNIVGEQAVIDRLTAYLRDKRQNYTPFAKPTEDNKRRIVVDVDALAVLKGHPEFAGSFKDIELDRYMLPEIPRAEPPPPVEHDVATLQVPTGEIADALCSRLKGLGFAGATVRTTVNDNVFVDYSRKGMQAAGITNEALLAQLDELSPRR